MDTKQCKRCGHSKPATTEFFRTHASRHKNGKTYLIGTCIECTNSQARERMRAYIATGEGAMKNRDRSRARPYDQRQAERAIRRANKAQALPAWFGELDALVWREAAHLVRLRTQATGFAWHADHMVPIACKAAAGLHVAHNCQVIPARMNMAKGASLAWSDPGSWIMSA
jgi:hypothetical protein